MKTLIFLFFGYFSSFGQSCLQLDMMIVADLSGSVNGYEPHISVAMYSFIEKFELSEEGLKIGIMTFNSTTTLICPLTSNKEFLLKSSREIPIASETTNMSAAFYDAIQELNGKDARPGYRKLIVIISDGVVDEPYITKAISKQIKNANIIVCGVLVGYPSDSGHEFMQEVCSNSYYVKSDYTSLPNQIKKLDICL